MFPVIRSHYRRILPFNQKGQSSVFILALIGVVLVCGIFLFESGRLTSEKMQLQNAADAAAFGASTLEARSLNFAAYTNRAMVANEVAVGQMVGILSVIDELKTSGEYLDAYGEAMIVIGAFLEEFGVGEVLDTYGGTLVEVGADITEVGEDIQEFMQPIASGIIRGLSIINTVYSMSQTVYHGATVVLETTTILQSLEDNVPGTTDFTMLNIFDPDKKGAHLSDLGILALACHIPSYWSGYTKRYSPYKEDKQEKEKKENKQIELIKDKIKKDEDDIARERKKYQNTVAQYKDKKVAFEKKKQECQELKNKDGSHSDTYKTCIKEQNALQKEVTGLQKKKKQEEKTLDSFEAQLKRDKDGLKEKEKELDRDKKEDGGSGPGDGMERMAATIREARDPFASGSGPILDDGWFGKQNYYNRNWNFGLGLELKKRVKILGVNLGTFGFDIYTGLNSKGGSEIRYKGNNFTWSGVDTAVFETKAKVYLFGEGIGMDPALPLGGGAYQAVGKSSGAGKDEEEGESGLGNQLTAADMPFSLSKLGNPKAYGDAGDKDNRWLSWEGIRAEMTEEDNVLNDTYGGLKPYRDINDADEADTKFKIEWPWESPFFLVGVTRKMDDITKQNRTNYDPDEAPHFSGNLDLLSSDSANPMVDLVGAIAKSEVYFDRPTDLAYFLRDDKKDEMPNVFSPFWQARLAKTSDTDRLIAMAIQHKKIWLARRDADALPGLEKVTKELEKILNLF